MVIDFAQRITSRLPEGISLFSLKLQETESSFAEWFCSDNLNPFLTSCNYPTTKNLFCIRSAFWRTNT
jgi:hypothetical protein